MQARYVKSAFIVLCSAICVFVLLPSTTYAAVCPGTLVDAQCIGANGAVYTWQGGDTPFANYSCADGYDLWSFTIRPGTIFDTAFIKQSGQTGLQCFSATTGAASTEPPIGEGTVIDPEATACEGTASFFNLTCWLRLIAVLIGTALVSITAWLLAISGMLFDFIVDKTILQFGSFFNEHLKTGVEAGWTALRDIANNVIIGMFTFIAISLILGIKEYGERKMIARVLIVAVLINFSLLFTKLIIDASNFTARQFYVAAELPRKPEGTTGVNDPTQFTQTGIAGQFITYMGVTSIGATWNALSNQAFGSKTNGFATANGWNALVHGVFSGVLLFTAAVVLLYGAFLLLARALLIIFLLITSALAFASYLVPQFAGSGYGWKTWWSSLLRNAVMAPLLIAFLWVSLLVGSQVKAKAGTLGSLVTNPQSTLDLDALFSYLIVLGLLFVSIRAASALSHTIAGFSMAAVVPAFGVGLAARLGGVLGRQFIGRPALNMSERLQKRAKDADLAGNTFRARLYDFGAQRLKTPAKRDFNALRTPLGGMIAKTAGVKVDTLTGKKLGGFEETQKAYLKRVGEQSRRIELSKDERDEIRAKGLDRALRENADLAQRYAESEKSQKENDGRAKALTRERDETAETFARSIHDLEVRLEGHRGALAGSAEGTPEREEATRRVEDAERALTEERKRERTELVAQKKKIDEAREASQRSSRMFKTATEDAEQTAIAAGDIPEKFREAGDIAKDIVRGDFTASLFKTSGLGLGSLEKLAEKAGKEAGKQKKNTRVKEDLGAALKELAKEEGGHETPPASGSVSSPASPGGGGGGGAGGSGH